MTNKVNHIIFDLDGTLIDSKAEILSTYRAVFSEAPPAEMPDVSRLDYGLTINSLLQGVYKGDAAQMQKAKALFASIYDNSDYRHTQLYDGVKETLQQLKDAGNMLYIATNKRAYPTGRILDSKGIRNLFSDVYANEMTAGVTLTKRQMIARLKAGNSFTEGYMVGDSVADIEAGNAENLITVAVTYGYETVAALSSKSPAHIISDFRNLSTFVAS